MADKKFNMVIRNSHGEIIYENEVIACDLDQARELIYDMFIQDTYADER